MSVNLLKSKSTPAVYGGHNLPAEYQEVEYLESTGEQYIDSLLTADSTLTIKVNFQYPDAFSINPMGAIKLIGNSYYRHHLLTSSNYICYGYGVILNTNRFVEYDNNIHDILIDSVNKKIVFDQNEISIYSSSFTTGLNYWLFARNAVNLSVTYSKVRIYEASMNNGMVFKTFVPCYRKSDNKPGLYDIINSVFYTNANTSATQDFIVGPEVGFDVQEVEPYVLKKGGPLWEAGYQEVECLESTGEQWIDTGILIDDYNYRAYLKINIPRVQDAGLLSTGITGECFSFDLQSPADKRQRIRIVSKNGNILGYTTFGVPNTFEVDFNFSQYLSYTINGTSVVASNAIAMPQTNNLLFLGATILFQRPTRQAKIYSFVIYHNDMQVRNFIPCYRRSDNKPGLYDTINSQFYTNANTSASEDFKVGPDVNKYVLQEVQPDILKYSTLLPTEYQELEYIQSTGEQYIDTGCIPSLPTNIIIDVESVPDFNNGWNWIIGGWKSRQGVGLECVPNSQKYFVCAFDDATAQIGVTPMGRHNFELNYDKNNCYYKVDGQIAFKVSYPITPIYPNAFSISYCKGVGLYTYSMSIKQNNILVRNYIPCYRKSDNKPGLYDLCGSICPLTGTPFYINANSDATQDFAKGPEHTTYSLNTIQPI